MSISIFGSMVKPYNFFNSNVIVRESVTTGFVKDAKGAILNSIKIGLNPMFVSNGEYATVSLKDGKVIANDDITDYSLSDSQYLLTWATKKRYTNEFSYFNVASDVNLHGLDMFRWFPKVCVSLFRREEVASYYFNDATSGFLYEGKQITGLRNQSRQTHHARGDVKANLVSLISGYFALQVSNCTLSIPDLSIATFQGYATAIVMSFKVPKTPKTKQVLFCTKSLERAVVLVKSSLQILGAEKSISLDYFTQEYNYLFILFDQNGTGLIQLNSQLQQFNTKRYQGALINTMYLFGRPGFPNTCFHGEIGTVDIYHTKDIPATGFPAPLRLEIIKNHMERIL